jgi:DNA-binding transcriptional LysR family regulator
LGAVVAFRGNVAGTVWINTPRVAASVLVGDILPRMAERFPDVTVDIVVEGRLIDTASHGFDAGVRLVGSIPRDMIAVPLANPIEFLCVAPLSYFDRAGEPATPDDLQHHRCIGHRLPSGKLYRWEFERAGQESMIEATGPVILADEDLMVEAALQDRGTACVASWAVEAAIAAGRLRPVLSAWMHTWEQVAVYYPGHQGVPPALRALLDVVRDVGQVK